MAKAKRVVVRSFSELPAPVVDLTKAAVVEPSTEDSAGGFVVGEVHEEPMTLTQEILDTIDPDEWAPDEEAPPVKTFSLNVPDEVVAELNGDQQEEDEEEEEIDPIDPGDEEVEEDEVEEEVFEDDLEIDEEDDEEAGISEETEEDSLAAVDLEDSDDEEVDDEVIDVEELEDDINAMYDIDASDMADTEHLRTPVNEIAQNVADLIAKDITEEGSVPDDVTIVSGDNTITVNDGEIEAVGSDGELISEDDEQRKAVLRQIKDFLPPGRLVDQEVFKNMTLRDLEDHLKLLQMNNGGSPSASKILQEIEEEYEQIINAPETKRRLALLQQKGIDFHKVAQKISKIMGNEVVVKNMRYQEYHQMLEHLTVSSTVIFREIAAAADYMGIDMPIDELVPSMGAIPISENMSIDEKTAMYVLRVLQRQVEHWHHACLLLQKNFDSDSVEKTSLKAQLKHTSDRLKDEVTNRDTMLSSIKQTFIEMPEYYIYVTGGGFLSLKDEDEELSVRNLELTNDIREALFLNGKKAAERIIEVISSKSKFADYNFKIRRLAAIEV